MPGECSGCHNEGFSPGGAEAQEAEEGSHGAAAAEDSAASDGSTSAEATAGGMGEAPVADQPEASLMRRPTSEAGDRLPGAVEPDVVLPAQFFTRPDDRAVWTGEQRLLAALLEDAVMLCSKHPRSPNPKRSHLVRDTLRWMRSDDRTSVFSFLRVCEILDLDPGAIRRGVRIRSDKECPADGRSGASGGTNAPQGGAAAPTAAR